MTEFARAEGIEHRLDTLVITSTAREELAS